MLIAEDLLLLLLDDDDGSTLLDGTATDSALAGAVLAELVAHGHVADVEPGRWSKQRRLVRRDGAVVADPLLAERLGRLGEPRTGSGCVTRLAPGLRTGLLERLVSSGHVREERRRVMWVFPVTRFPETDAGHEDALRAGLAEVVTGHRTPEPREAVLLSLLDAVKALGKVLPTETAGLDDEQLHRRVAEVSEDEAVPAAVRKAVDDARAAVNAAIMTAAVGAAVAGSS